MVNVWSFLCLLLFPMALFTFSNLYSGGQGFPSIHEGFVVPIMLVGGVVSLLLAPAIPYVQLQSVYGNEVTLTDAIKVGFSKFWRFYGLVLLSALIILGGLLLLIVPGLFMIRRYLLAPFYLYDKDLKILEAMRQSAEDSRKHSRAIWGLIGVQFLLSLISAVPILMLASALLSVVYYCAPAVRYDQVRR